MVLQCAEALKDAFELSVETSITTLKNEGYQVPKGTLPTLSVGIAIGHYAEHLQSMLKRSHDAENTAKIKRNSIAVSFSSHSGGGDDRKVSHEWKDHPISDYWWKAIDFHRQDVFPDGAAYQLDELRRELTIALRDDVYKDFSDEQVKTLIVAEVTRILSRKEARGGSAATRDAIVKDVAARLQNQHSPKATLAELGNFVNEAIIARRMLAVLPQQKFTFATSGLARFEQLARNREEAS
jgi:CRISPR-associated protein Cmr2